MRQFGSGRNRQLPLLAHVVQRLAVGGLENGVVNLINHMPYDRYDHVVICLADSTDYSLRIQRKDVQLIVLNQRPGRDFRVYRRFLRVLRALQPDIVHTRNLPTLEFQAAAALAGVKGRVHGEHGRDMYDLDGRNFKYNALRKSMRVFIHRYVAVSRDLSKWLVDAVNVASSRITQIYNGVDAKKFYPRRRYGHAVGPPGFTAPDCFVIGTVGRMEPVKDQLTLVRAFLRILGQNPGWRKSLRLVIVGDGSLRAPALKMIREAQAEQLAWLPGERHDISEIMQGLDLFVLPSLREGISNTILEAMASGLPVVATNVGGNPELVQQHKTGTLVPHSDAVSMAGAIGSYVGNANKPVAHGQAGRRSIESQFTMETMVSRYADVYDSLLRRDPARTTASHSRS